MLPIWLYNDIYINTMSLILALLHQIESFHRLQIKPNKLDLSQEKLTLVTLNSRYFVDISENILHFTPLLTRGVVT